MDLLFDGNTLTITAGDDVVVVKYDAANAEVLVTRNGALVGGLYDDEED